MNMAEKAVLAWLVALFGVIVSMLVWPMLDLSWLKDQGLAAEIQAVGSLVGIAVAIAVPATQHFLAERRAERARQLADAQKLEVVLGAVLLLRNSCEVAIFRITESNITPSKFESAKGAIERAVRVLGSLPFFDIADARLAGDVVELLGEGSILLSTIEAVRFTEAVAAASRLRSLCDEVTKSAGQRFGPEQHADHS